MNFASFNRCRNVALSAAMPVLLCGCLGDGFAMLPPTSAYDRANDVPFYGNEQADCRLDALNCLPHNQSPKHQETSIVDRGYSQPPILNVSTTCSASSKFQGSDDRHFCLTDEYAAKAQLKSKWHSFKTADRRDCLALSRSISPSYVETLTCLELSNNTVIASTITKDKFVRTSPATDIPAEIDTTGSLKQFPAVKPPVKGYIVPP